MIKEDFRSKSTEAQNEVKKAVIKLLKLKKKQYEIADLFSIRPQTVSKWWKISFNS